VAKFRANVFHVAEEKPVRETERCAGLHRGEDLLEVFSLRRVRDENDDEVRFSDDFVHFSQGAVSHRKAGSFRPCE
jgi:hypothetical protein